MAKSSSQNQKFLQQFERQRLNKICNRIIDLRGKVAGECQAYTFGGKTHHLDDRGYLLAKQLLAHFNGQYTFGVYEGILKTLTQLKQSKNKLDESGPAGASQLVDSVQIPFVKFEHFLQRKETRILYTTPVELMINDVLYHASTLDITSSSINIVLKLAYTMTQGDTVQVHFADLVKQSSLLNKINYKVLNISHADNRTTVILTRNKKDQPKVTAWFEQWANKHNTPAYLDLNIELSNLTSRYYLRLYTQSLTMPLLWLGHSKGSENVKALHLMPAAEPVLNKLQDDEGNLQLSLLPISNLSTSQDDFIVVIYHEDNQTTSLSAPRNKAHLVAKVIKWHQQHINSHLLLLNNTQYRISEHDFNQEIQPIADKNESYATQLGQRLNSIQQSMTIIDISHSCSQLDPIALLDKNELIVPNGDLSMSIPAQANDLKYQVERHTQRFILRTEIHVSIKNEIYKISSDNASDTGLSFTLPEKIELPPNTRIFVDFVRWQRQTTRSKFTHIPFLVKNTRIWQGKTIVGLERDITSCSPAINISFSEIMEKNKDKLTLDNQHIILSQETHIFSSLFSKSMTVIPFYLGKDTNNNRVIQAIATSNNNKAEQYPSLWVELDNYVISFLSILQDMDKNQVNVSFGLYCYQDNHGQWTINTEYDFSSTSQKSIFLSLALASKQHVFYQCTLTSLTTKIVEDEKDLNQKLALWRNHSPHKIKQVREVLSSLFAIGQLSDISDIIEAAYKSN